MEVSPDLISTVTDAVVSEITAWQTRPLDPLYPVVFFDERSLVHHRWCCRADPVPGVEEPASDSLSPGCAVPMTATMLVLRTTASRELVAFACARSGPRC